MKKPKDGAGEGQGEDLRIPSVMAAITPKPAATPRKPPKSIDPCPINDDWEDEGDEDDDHHPDPYGDGKGGKWCDASAIAKKVKERQP